MATKTTAKPKVSIGTTITNDSVVFTLRNGKDETTETVNVSDIPAQSRDRITALGIRAFAQTSYNPKSGQEKLDALKSSIEDLKKGYVRRTRGRHSPTDILIAMNTGTTAVEVHSKRMSMTQQERTKWTKEQLQLASEKTM